MKAIQETLAAALMALILVGCATKTRNVEIDGLFSQVGSQILAVGSVDVMATPQGEEAATLKFGKSYNYFQSQPNYDIKLQLTGTNSVAQVPDVVKSICTAFLEVAADLHQATSANAFNSPVTAVSGAAK